MQLTRTAGVGLLVLAATAATAAADGELELRTVYYKERSTRVEQPMLDAHFDAGDNTTVDGHLLIDAITSASTAATDGAPFDEIRYEGGAGYTRTLGIYTVGGTVKYSTEPDYKSAFVTLRGQAELYQRNLTLALTVGAGRDDVYNVDTFVGSLHSFLWSASVAQILSPNAIASFTYDLSYLDGYQENTYRRVIVRSPGTGTMAVEEVPDQRSRHALAASVRWFREASSTTLVAGYRFYFDSWGLLAHTPEVRLIQDAGETVQLGLRYRYHRQTGTDFYDDDYTMVEPLITADPKLSPFSGHAFAVKFDVTGGTFGLEDRLGAVRGELIIEYDFQNNDFHNAVQAQAALTIPFEY